MLESRLLHIGPEFGHFGLDLAGGAVQRIARSACLAAYGLG